jgi:hypothetical protein
MVIWPVLLCLTILFQLCVFIWSILNHGIGGVVAHMNALSQSFVSRAEGNEYQLSGLNPGPLA